MKSKKWITYLIIVSCAVNFLFLGGGFVFIQQAKNALYDEKVNYLEEISLKTAQNIQSNIYGYTTTIEAIASLVSTYNTNDAQYILSLLKTESTKNSFKRMGIIFPDGEAVTTDSVTFSLGDREYFKQAMDGKTVVSNKVLVDKVGGGEINVIATPFYNGNEIVGVIFATKSQDEFSDIMQVNSFGGEGYSYIITCDGSPAARTHHPNSVGEYSNLFNEMTNRGISDKDLKKMKDNIKNGQNGTFENLKAQVKNQVYYTKIGINDWYLVSVVPTKAISQESDNLIKNITICTFAVVLFVMLLSVLIILNLKRNNDRLEKIAYEDKITGFFNWDKFYMMSQDILSKNKNNNYAMISFDINKFGVFNDLFGHSVGNTILKNIAKKVNQNINPYEAFTRVSADRFTILMQYEVEQEIIDRINQLSNDVKDIVPDYTIELSVGIYLIDGATLNIEILNDRANIARNVAKQQNDIFYSFFSEKNRQDILKEKEIENIMESALKANEFEVYLQPKYCLKTSTVIGAEALVRWNRDGVLIPPNDFIPLFEKNGFIRKLDTYMFEKVCSLLSKWGEHSNIKTVPVSVNLSRVHLPDNNLPQKLLAIMKQYNIHHDLLEFELTESAVYSDVENMKVMIEKIKELGIHVSIDDFGSGYSSLSTLKDLPIDIVKLDKTFFDDLFNDIRGQSIVSDILTMSKNLGLTTVAEGIETKEQIDFLKGIGCEIVQGYYYSRPLPVFDFEKLVSSI